MEQKFRIGMLPIQGVGVRGEEGGELVIFLLPHGGN